MKSFLLKYKFQIYLTIILIIGIIFIIIYLFNPTIPIYNKKLEELGNKDKPFYIRYIIIALAAIATAIFTWWKNFLNAKQVEVLQKQAENIQFQTTNSLKQIEAIQSQIKIQEETRLDSLFAKAVEFLNDKNDLTTRKSGVHILKDIALASPKHTQKCVDMLCSINELWMPWLLDIDPDFFQKNSDFLNIQNIDNVVTTQIAFKNISFKNNMQLSQLVLKVVSQLIKEISNNNLFNEPFDLSYKYLCSISMSNISLKNFNLNHINFNNSFLYEVDFSHTLNWHSDFQNSMLINCNFENSQLPQSIFNFAKLNTVNFNNSNIEDASFLNTNFINTEIKNARNYGKAFFND